MGSVKKIGSDICNDFISFEENILRLSAKLYRQSLVSAFPARYETNRNKFAIPNERNASFLSAKIGKDISEISPGVFS